MRGIVRGRLLFAIEQIRSFSQASNEYSTKEKSFELSGNVPGMYRERRKISVRTARRFSGTCGTDAEFSPNHHLEVM
jgi:hypothetical protein